MLSVDVSNYKGREQAFVKHYLLLKYLPELAYKVGRIWDAIAYVDAFSGPWKSKDPHLSDTSFGIAIDTLRHSQLGMSEKGMPFSAAAILVESDKGTYSKLKPYAQSKNIPGFLVCSINDEFVNAIPEINDTISHVGSNPFKFVLLDPTGWADIPMASIAPFLNSRSCEVLVNLMTQDIIRFLNQDTRAASYNNLFGRPGVLEALRVAAGDEKVDLAVKEYCKSLKLLCKFKYASSAVILEPAARSIKYFLVYATNHYKGIEVFKRAEMQASRIQEELRKQKQIDKTQQPGFQFDTEPQMSSYALGLHSKYSGRARRKLIEKLRRSRSNTIQYRDLFCETMAFPLVTPDDLTGWLEQLRPAIEIQVGEGHRTLSLSHPCFIEIKDRAALL